MLQLYEPLGVPKPVADGVWIVDGPAVSLSIMGAQFPYPTRMTVVRLRDGGLWCHSPIALDDALRGHIEALGPVRHLVSPNKLHYVSIAAWQAVWPDAKAWASPDVRERAAKHGQQLRFDADLQDAPPADWADDIDQLVFQGSKQLPEVVFFHRASATLVLADMIENFETERMDLRWRWLVKATGAADPDGSTPRDIRATFWGHRDEARACLRRMLDWRPERVILAHGRWYERDGTAELERAFRWLL